MKRALTLFLLTCALLTLISCRNDSETVTDDTSVVFRGEIITDKSAEPAASDELPAYHGGKVISQSLLDNGMILQEELVTEEDSVTHHCNILNRSGELSFSVMPASDLGYDLSGDNIFSGDTFRLTDAVSLADELYIFASPAGICSYDSSGKLRWTTSTTAVDMLCTDSDILLLTAENGVQSLRWLDADSGEVGKSIKLSGESVIFSSPGESDILYLGEDSCIYAADTNGLYQLDFADGDESSAEVTLCTDWMKSGISPSDILSISVIDSKTFDIALDSEEEGETLYMHCTMIPADEVPVIEDITLVLFSACTDYQLQVLEFNRENTEYQIVTEDYRQYENDQRKLLFNAELAAGNVPDIVIMEQYASPDTTIPTYERSGIFTDLTPLLQSDEDFRYDDLLSYITEPFKLNGEQYLFPLNLSVRCYFGSPELFDGPVTVDEYLDICEREGLKPFGISGLLSAAVDDHYDEETAVCTFNDGVLEAQMKRASALREANEGSQPLTLLSMTYSTLVSYAKELAEIGEGMTLIPVGAPNAERKLYMDEPNAEVFSITKSSTHKEAAVDFLQTLIVQNTPKTDNAEPIPSDRPYSTPLGTTFYKDDVYAQLEALDGKILKFSGAVTFVYDPEEGPSDEAAQSDGYEILITRDIADDFCSFLDSITSRVNPSGPAQDIFWSEYRSMKDRPIDVMLDYAQSKISIYLAETMD